VSAPHATALFRVVHRGFARDCEYIEVSNYIYELKGNGVNEPATLADAPGNCFDLYNKSTYGPFLDPLTDKDVTATAYQYQNGLGHCLWLNETSHLLELGVACNPSDTSEYFFGIPGSYAADGGWVVSDVAQSLANGGTPDYYMESPGCDSGAQILMVPSTDFPICYIWNFPQG
jgi:hypothetical protein